MRDEGRLFAIVIVNGESWSPEVTKKMVNTFSKPQSTQRSTEGNRQEALGSRQYE